MNGQFPETNGMFITYRLDTGAQANVSGIGAGSRGSGGAATPSGLKWFQVDTGFTDWFNALSNSTIQIVPAPLVSGISIKRLVGKNPQQGTW